MKQLLLIISLLLTVSCKKKDVYVTGKLKDSASRTRVVSLKLSDNYIYEYVEEVREIDGDDPNAKAILVSPEYYIIKNAETMQQVCRVTTFDDIKNIREYLRNRKSNSTMPTENSGVIKK